ncbi:hypothetical protein TrRE_jg9648, partial [Triparma retinervis]
MGKPSMSSEECLSWLDLSGSPSPQCSPMGGQSVWASQPPDFTEERGGGTVMVATNMDGRTLFDGAVPAGDEVVSGIVTELLVARAIGGLGEDVKSKLNKRILFTFFSSETSGSLGSTKFFTDTLTPFTCPLPTQTTSDNATKPLPYDPNFPTCLNPLYPSLRFTSLPNTVPTTISLSSLGSGGSTLYSLCYNGPDPSNQSQIQSILSSLSVPPGSATALPPSPLDTLISMRPTSATGCVITSHPSSPDPLVGTIYDTPSRISLQNLASAATKIARAVVADAVVGVDGMTVPSASSYATSNVPAVTADDSEISKLLACFGSQGSACEAVKDARAREDSRNALRTGYGIGYMRPMGEPPNYGGGVYTSGNEQPWIYLDGEMIAATGDGDKFESEGGFVTLQPSELSAALKGLLSYYLQDGGQGTSELCGTDGDCGGGGGG